MQRVLALTAMALSMAVATPASAGIVLGSGGAQPISVSFLGYGGSPAANIPQLTGTLGLVFTGTSNGGLTYNFNYSVDNTSSVVSSLSGFGFDVNPNISGAVSTGLYQYVNTTSNVPNIGVVDVCFNSGSSNSCAGAGSGAGGLLPAGGVANGTLSLTFGQAYSQIDLTNFYVRYQGIAGITGVTSAVGRPTTPPVPEPATWAMMLLGFGGIGMAMRYRRRTAKLAQIA